MSRRFLIVFLALFAMSQASSQYLGWQKPVERDLAEIARIVGPVEQREPSRDLNIVWVWGIDKMHPKKSHEHAWVMDRYVHDLLQNVPRVTATDAYYWPSKKQWENADLVVFYLMPRNDGAGVFNDSAKYEGDPRSIWDYDTIDAYQERGGGLVFLHMALMEGTGIELSKRIGLAWNLSPRIPTTYAGVLAWPVDLTSAGRNSPIFEGLPGKIKFEDELYWPLFGDPAKVTTLVTSPSIPSSAGKGVIPPPNLEELDGKAWQVAWTTEVGKGKVFGTVLGHNFFTFNDPYFRIILLRAMAWTMNESFDPFKPLVTLHLGR
jgi:hypothetical protein